MFFKIKGFVLLILLILIQSCTGGRVGNFLESSFDNLEKKTEKKSQKVLKKETAISRLNRERNKTNIKEKKLEEKSQKVLMKQIAVNKEKIERNVKNNKEKKPKENIQKVLKKKKDLNREKSLVQAKKTSVDKKSLENLKKDLQSYKIIFILKDVDPKDPIKELSTILRNSKVNFEIEKIERFFDSKNKNMKKTF